MPKRASTNAGAAAAMLRRWWLPESRPSKTVDDERWIVPLNVYSGSSWLQRLARPSASSQDHGGTNGLGLDGDVGSSFPLRRQQHNIEYCQCQCAVARRRQEANAGTKTMLVDKALHGRSQGTFAKDQEDCIRPLLWRPRRRLQAKAVVAFPVTAGTCRQ